MTDAEVDDLVSEAQSLAISLTAFSEKWRPKVTDAVRDTLAPHQIEKIESAGERLAAAVETLRHE